MRKEPTSVQKEEDEVKGDTRDIAPRMQDRRRRYRYQAAKVQATRESMSIPPSAGYRSCSPSVHSSYERLGTILGTLRGNKIPLLNIRPTKNLVQYLLSNCRYPNPQNNSAKIAPPITANISVQSVNQTAISNHRFSLEILGRAFSRKYACRQIHTHIDCGLRNHLSFHNRHFTCSATTELSARERTIPSQVPYHSINPLSTQGVVSPQQI